MMHAGGDERPSRIPFPDQDLLLAQKIEVSVTAGTRIDDGGKVPGKIVGIAAITQGKSEGNLQRYLGCPDDFTVFPRLTVNRDFTARSNCIQERLAVASKKRRSCYHARKQ